MKQPTFGKRPTVPVVRVERRRSTRNKTTNRSKIIVGSQELDCLILNLSQTGAHLRVASILGIPGTFDLEDSAGRRRLVRVVRRGASRVSVKFI